MQPSVKVIIPAFNEEASIGLVVQDIPALVEEVIVVSNGSTDQTEAIAKETGATVLQEPKRRMWQRSLGSPILLCFWMATTVIIRSNSPN